MRSPESQRRPPIRTLTSGSGSLASSRLAAAACVAAFACFGGSELARGQDAPEVTLHLSFDTDSLVKHARGQPYFLCLAPDVVQGKKGRGLRILSLDGTVQMESEGNLDRSRGTILMWYKPEFPHGTEATYPLLWSGQSSDVGANAMWLWVWGGSLRFDVRDPKDSYCTMPIKGAKPGVWMHIAAVWDCTRGLSLWVDGVKRMERDAVWTTSTESASLLLGTGSGPAERATAGGVIDEVKILDRPLSQTEIEGEFRGTRSFAYSSVDRRESARKAAKHVDEPLETTFRLDFERGFTASSGRGELEPLNQNLPALVAGKTGRGATLKPGQTIRFTAAGTLRKERGAISLWLKTPEDRPFASKDMVFFREDGPDGPGENCLWFWVWRGSGLRVDPRDAADSYSVISSSMAWKRGEWHHVAVSWDCSAGMMAYFDGQLVLRGGGGDAGKTFIPLKWEPRTHDAFLIGSHSADGWRAWEGILDDVTLYNRPLTPVEVRAEYLRGGGLPIAMRALDPYPYAGEKGEISVVCENLSERAHEITIHSRMSSSDIAYTGKEHRTRVRVEGGASRKVSIPVRPPVPGPYALSLRAEGDGESTTQVVDVVAVEKVEPAVNGPRRLVEVDDVDVTTIAYAIESAPSKIVDFAPGRYREAGAGRNDRFAVKFRVRELYAPHVAVIEYPDDKPRTMDVILQPLGVPHDDYQAQTGVFTGDEYTLSGRMLEHRIAFWPQCEELSFIFMTAEAGRPAAARRVRVYRMEGGFERLAVKPFEGSVPARHIGLYHEDPVFPQCYGRAGSAEDVMSSFPGFATTIDRMLDYHQSFGMDTIHYPVAWYHGPLYGSEVERHVVSTRPHPPGFPAYLMRRLAARGMAFNGWLHMHQIESLYPHILLDEERVFAGEETPINMRFDNHLFYRAWHGKDPVLNPLDPRVREAVANIVREIAERYGDEPAFTGLTLNTVRHSIFAFGSLESGYNDVNLTRFQRDTGIRIPVDGKDRYRFARSWKWLMDNAKQEWIAWRCASLREYYKELAAILTARRRDLTLGLVIFAAEDGNADNGDYLGGARDVQRAAREQGIDPALFEGDREIVLRYSMVPADLRWRRGHGTTSPGIEDTRTVNSAPEIVAPLARTVNASANMHDRYFENAVGGEHPLEGLPATTKECGWRVSALNANSFHSLENYAFAMNNLDPLQITKGGFLIGTMGMEAELARFARAYRGLPAVKFDDVEGLDDPVRVRQKVVDGHTYLYVLNRLPFAARVEIVLAGRGAVVDLVAGRRVDDRRRISLELAPYDLVALRASDAATVASHGTPSIDQVRVDALEKKVAEMAATCGALEAAGADVARLAPYAAMAEECLATKRYARLHFLLQESWVARLRALSKNSR